MKNLLEKMAQAQKQNQAFNIVAVGDSVTNGSFRDDKDFECVWHARLRRLLNGIFPDLRINMINSGIDGDNAAGVLRRLEEDVLCYRPGLVILCIGLNDITAPAEKFLGTVSQIAARVAQSGADLIYLTPNCTVSRVQEEEIRKLFGADWAVELAHGLAERQNSGVTDTFFEKAAKSAAAAGAVVCDAYRAWKALSDAGVDTTKLLANGINHPTREMHAVFAALLLETMLLK